MLTSSSKNFEIFTIFPNVCVGSPKVKVSVGSPKVKVKVRSPKV
jgi:hypothetical protein